MFQSIYNLLSLRTPKPQRAEMALGFFQLSRMLDAGVSLSDALDDLVVSDGVSRRQHAWKNIANGVSSGKSLSDSLVAFTGISDKTVYALLRTGEAAGQLGAACNTIYEYLQWHHELRQRIITLLIYPLFSLCVLVGVTGFLFISVVPSIKGFLMASGGELEWHTVALIGLSTWMSHYYPAALVSVVVLVLIASVMLLVSSKLRFICDRCVLKIPLIGRLVIDLTLSRYARCCAQLYANSVSLESSMELAEGTVANQLMRSELVRARATMVNGATLADALNDVSVMPSLFLRLVAVGEKSGKLDEVLIQIGKQQNATAQATIERTEQLIGPVLLMIVGAMLLWIVISVLGPVYKMAIATVVGV